MPTSNTDNASPNSSLPLYPDSPSPKWPSYQRLLEVIRDLVPRAKKKADWDVRCPCCNVILLSLEFPIELHNVVVMKHIVSNKYGAVHLRPQELKLFFVLLAAYPATVEITRLRDLVVTNPETDTKVIHVITTTLRAQLAPLHIKVTNHWNSYSLEIPV